MEERGGPCRYGIWIDLDSRFGLGLSSSEVGSRNALLIRPAGVQLINFFEGGIVGMSYGLGVYIGPSHLASYLVSTLVERSGWVQPLSSTEKDTLRMPAHVLEARRSQRSLLPGFSEGLVQAAGNT